MSDYENLLRSILSASPDDRNNAENTMNNMLQTDPSTFTMNLLHGMALPAEELAALSAVLFRRKILEESLMERMSPECKQACRDVITLFTANRSMSFLKNLADCTLLLAISEHFEGELLNSITQWIASDVPVLREVAVYIFELATEHEETKQFLSGNISAAIQILTQGLGDADLSIKISAVKSTACFLSVFESEQAVMQYVSVTETLLLVLTDAIQAIVNKSQNAAFEDKVKSAFSSLSDLSQQYARIWHTTLQSVTTLSVNTAKTQNLSKEVRGAAVELILTIMTKAPGMFKGNVTFIQEMITLGMTLLVELEHGNNIDAWNSEHSRENGIFTQESFSLGKEILDKLTVTMKGQNVLPHIMQLLPLYLQSEDWVRQHTGVIAVGVISEGCHELFDSNLQELLTMILPFMTHAQPRLKWAACTTLGLVLSEFAPKIELFGHAQIVPAISACLAEGNLLRVQIQGACCLENFLRALLDSDDDTKHAILPYTENLLGMLFTLLSQGVSSNQYQLLTEVLNSLQVLADLIEDAFVPFYNQFMPGLKQVAAINPSDPLQAETRAVCIRCIGSIVEACAGTCNEDANSIFQTLMGMLETLPFDDPSVLAIKETSVNFAAGMKEVFAPYMQPLMAELLKDASNNVDIYLTDTESPNNPVPSKNIEAVRCDLPGLGTKQITINTTVMEAKIKAVKILYDLVGTLEKSFAPYVEATMQVLEPLFSFAHNDDIRKFALRTAAKAIGCFEDTAKAEGYLRIMFPVLREKITACLVKFQKDTKRLINCLKVSCESVESVAVVGLPEAIETSKCLAAAVSQVFERKVARAQEREQFQGDDVYYEELDLLQEEDDIDDEIIRGTMVVIGHFLKSFKLEYQQVFTECFKNMYSQLFYKPNATDIEIQSAVCIFDDYVEHTGDLMVENGKSIVLDEMIKFALHGNADVRQSSAYGIGVCAQLLSPEMFNGYKQDILNKLSTIISAQNAREPENVSSTECAIGALGRIAVAQSPDMIQQWLSYLPLKGDAEEACDAHKFFLRQAPNLKQYPEAAKVYGDLCALGSGTEYLDEEGTQLMIQAGALFA